MKPPYWIVLADTHLGAIHWQNPQREDDYYLAFQTQCRLAALDPTCLGIIGLGDIRERASLQAKSLGGLNRGLKILADHNKPLLAIMGNHDFTIPNWIEEMCYPSLKNLADPLVQKAYGFNPLKTLALNYTPKSLLLSEVAAQNPKNLSLLFLHQSLKELGTNLKQSYDFTLTDLKNIGIGKNHPCLIFLGDLHNYGDITIENITAVYPGSLEMTDINEGVNGLKSQKISSSPHDYRKFVIHFVPSSNTWEPVPLSPRPWIRTKAKTPREAHASLASIQRITKTWLQPGCILATCPSAQLTTFKEELASIPTLECRIDEYDPTEEVDRETCNYTSLSWLENKVTLATLAEEELEQDAFDLVQKIIAHDGSRSHPKNDVWAAWEAWNKLPEDESASFQLITP